MADYICQDCGRRVRASEADSQGLGEPPICPHCGGGLVAAEKKKKKEKKEKIFRRSFKIKISSNFV
ncbi:MAG: hypothetical protein UV20_C0034G0006 [Candidatus Magasanikbacteria bacterium GW2011_GWA2_42_32]|uniref:Uncharacterized protein n=1 Tax=Candidatus Magasanikbacteria bacterium GW2011_GWA2_42_32 TaxID=1619039 RepID=A0A0G1CXK4_9BACT|nr:MAG: hypothetical protein UV20_C0034G0006 [Candidatus Magasanikbacteria bacterium GW2011_GWA2_42_32]